MAKLTEKYTIRFSKKQIETLAILEAHNVIISKFIRQAIKEKIQRDWQHIKNEFIENKNSKLPF